MGTIEDHDVVLSLVMPVYNEGHTLRTILERLGTADIPVPYELIVVDDGSTDDAVEHIDRAWVPHAQRFRVVRSRRNLGKGSALRKGFSLATGSIVGVQDADLEYDPHQIGTLLQPLLNGRADVVFGSREFGAHASYSFWYVMGNRALTLFACILFNRYVTDIYTCYKFIKRDVLLQVQLTADGFEIEAQLAGGILRAGSHVYEVPITYMPRTREEGKKIAARDGVVGALELILQRIRPPASHLRPIGVTPR